MKRTHERTHEPATTDAPMAAIEDPVCGMTVRDDSPHRVTHDGVQYFFCSESCLTKVRDCPEQYTNTRVTENNEP